MYNKVLTRTLSTEQLAAGDDRRIIFGITLARDAIYMQQAKGDRAVGWLIMISKQLLTSSVWNESNLSSVKNDWVRKNFRDSPDSTEKVSLSSTMSLVNQFSM